MEFEDVKNALSENEGLRKALVEHIVSTDEGKSVIQNHVKVQVDETIGSKIKETYTLLDEMSKDVMGIEKPDGAKSTEHIRSLLEQAKQNSTNLTDLQAKYSDLEKKADKGESADLFREKYEMSKQANEKLQSDYERQINELNSKFNNMQIEGAIKGQLSNLKFNESLPKEVVDNFVADKISKLVGNSEIKDGVLIHRDAEGKAIITNTGEFKNTSDLLKDELKSILASEGSGGGNGKPEAKVKPNGVALETSTARTRREFIQAIENGLINAGIKRGTSEWNQKYDETLKANKDDYLKLRR